MYGLRPAALDDLLAEPRKAPSPSRTSFGIHVLDDDDPRAPGSAIGGASFADAEAVPVGGATMHGRSLAEMMGSMPSAEGDGREAVVGPGTPTTGSTIYGRSPFFAESPSKSGAESSSQGQAAAGERSQEFGSHEAPSARPEVVDGGARTSLGIAALADHADPVKPIGSTEGGMSLADDWLDDIQSFIDEKVADGTLAVPGMTPHSVAEVPTPASTTWTPHAVAPSRRDAQSASSAVHAPDATRRPFDTGSSVAAASSDESAPPADPSVAGFGIVQKRRSKRANSVSTGPMFTAGTMDRQSLGREASAGQMRDEVGHAGVAEMSAAVIDAGTDSVVPLRFGEPSPLGDPAGLGRPVEAHRSAGPLADQPPASVLGQGLGPAGVPESQQGLQQGARPGAPFAEPPATRGLAPQLAGEGSPSLGDAAAGPARTIAFSPGAALDLALGDDPALSASAPAADFVAPAADFVAPAADFVAPAADLAAQGIEGKPDFVPAELVMPNAGPRRAQQNVVRAPEKASPAAKGGLPTALWIALALLFVILVFVVAMKFLG